MVTENGVGSAVQAHIRMHIRSVFFFIRNSAPASIGMDFLLAVGDIDEEDADDYEDIDLPKRQDTSVGIEPEYFVSLW